MQIDSPRFGTLVVEPERIIEFPGGLVGFENCRRFSLFHPEGEDPPHFILQSLDDPNLAFQIVDPVTLGFNYELNLSDADKRYRSRRDQRDQSRPSDARELVEASGNVRGERIGL